jgi:hypothetical protein
VECLASFAAVVGAACRHSLAHARAHVSPVIYLNKLGVRVKQRDGTNCFNRLLEYGLTCVWVAGTPNLPNRTKMARKGSSTNPDP